MKFETVHITSNEDEVAWLESITWERIMADVKPMTTQDFPNAQPTPSTPSPTPVPPRPTPSPTPTPTAPTPKEG